MKDAFEKIYGRGWTFPPSFSLTTDEDKQIVGQVDMVQGKQSVHQSLRILFSTQPGERIMRSEYGCDLQRYMFKNISEELLAQLKTELEEGLNKFEPRAIKNNIQCWQDNTLFSQINITISYRLRGSDLNQSFNGEINLENSRYTGII